MSDIELSIKVLEAERARLVSEEKTAEAARYKLEQRAIAAKMKLDRIRRDKKAVEDAKWVLKNENR